MSTVTDLELGIPSMRYDITLPLVDGRVEVEGVRLKPARLTSMVFGDVPALRQGDFGLCDLNLGYFLPALEAGWELIGLPVFSKRKPAFQFIFCRTDRGIETPKDLEGKRIGSRSYRTALTVWCRGFLQHRYGVDITRLKWVVSGQEFFPVYDQATAVQKAEDPQKNPVQSLLDGDVDALLTDISDEALFQTLETSPQIKRLFPHYIDEDEKLFAETSIYTPVHLIVMSKRLERERPDLAAKLYRGFEQAKQIAYRDIRSDLAGFSVVYLRERMKEQTEKWGDPFKYGVSANRKAIDTFVGFNVEQGMVRSTPSYEQMFASGTLST